MALSRRKKIIIGVIAAVLLTSIIIISVFASRKDVPEASIVKLETKRELRSTVTASGEVRPIQFINLTSEVQGRIEEIYVKEGDVVTKGQPLVRLDPDQLQSSTDAQNAAFQAAQNESQVTRSQIIAAQNQYSQAQQGQIASDAAVATALQQVASARDGVNTAREAVNQARQQVVASQTDVDRSNVELNASRRELKRSEELLESGVISKLEYDQAKDRVSNAEVALRNSQARLEAQRISVTEAQSRVRQAENSVVEAQNRVKESQARAGQQTVAVKDARRGMDTATYSANASSKRADQSAAVLRGQRNQRDKTLQEAPIAGVIADIPSKVGTFAVANLSSTPLLTIADMSTINVEVKVDETEIDKVEVGQKAKVKVDAFGDKELIGEVTQKTPLAVGKSQTTGGLSTNINVQEAKEFRVVIQLKEAPDEIRNGLRPGMSATATITTKTVENVITVPLQALVEKQPESPTPTPEGMKNDVQSPAEKPKNIKGVFILEDGKKAKFIEVVTGITGESDIEIKSGLTADQEVITGPSRILKTLKDGDAVKKQTKKEGENANKS
ncbi:MAG: HlyD family efflux transporter periplasmic adaptor subunit [Acidobacteriota bacterium]